MIYALSEIMLIPKSKIMRKFSLFCMLFAFVVFILSGCLTVEKKLYKFEFTGENSGILTIDYINIMSIMDDTLDVSKEDFDELLSDYIYGDQIESEFPEAQNLQKDLYEKDGMLCAKITMEFTELSDVLLYQYKGQGPYMKYLGGALDTEYFYDANGEFGGENMPVIFWESDLSILDLVTEVTAPDETTVSLIDKYREWKGN